MHKHFTPTKTVKLVPSKNPSDLVEVQAEIYGQTCVHVSMHLAQDTKAAKRFTVSYAPKGMSFMDGMNLSTARRLAIELDKLPIAEMTEPTYKGDAVKRARELITLAFRGVICEVYND